MNGNGEQMNGRGEGVLGIRYCLLPISCCLLRVKDTVSRECNSVKVSDDGILRLDGTGVGKVAGVEKNQAAGKIFVMMRD